MRPATVRMRRGGLARKQTEALARERLAQRLDALAKRRLAQNPAEWDYWFALLIITVLAFITRFWGISHPDEVVFDEVWVGKYASYYLERTYFFDIHPPFGKLLFALIGWFAGYDGHFHFNKIGDSYITNEVPYVAFRALPALLGALTVLVVFHIMWESGYTLPACILSACLVLFDNAHIIQTRLILLDPILVFAMSCSLLCYIKFYKLRHVPFGRKWWMWLLLTGFSLSSAISTKYVGLFAFVTIGSVVIIDLWDLSNINHRQGAQSLLDFMKHFASRLFALIILPFFFYLFWFQVHFAILSRSGPGDHYMSPQFQETLSGNAIAAAVTIHYYDTIQIRHKNTKAYLHSHLHRYPFRYEGGRGRVSSQGQQVTGFLQPDENNHWEIIPLVDDQLAGHVVKNNDTVRLRHLATNTMLLSHNVASPYYSTNQEFTTVPMDQALDTRFNDTLFELRIENSNPGQEFQSLIGEFKLIHKPSNFAMWTHPRPLPAWGFHQQEINGNKNISLSSNIWFVDEIPSIPADSQRLAKQELKPKSMPFFKKWFELQHVMFARNNALRRGHPAASKPFRWPFLSKGISYWTKADTRQQIFFLGNLIGWWIASSLLVVFASIILAGQISLHRGINALDYRTRSRLYKSTGFFFLAWATHYLPFYLMGRDRFLHHYLPAHLASALVAGSLLDFIFKVDLIDDGSSSMAARKGFSSEAKKRPARDKLVGRNLTLPWAAMGIILALILGGWYYWLPLTYGYRGVTPDEVNARKWLGLREIPR